MTKTPTEVAYTELQEAYHFLNQRLFDSKLPGAMITFQRNKRTFGYYAPNNFFGADGEFIDEIAMNPVYFATRSAEEVLSTLAHEMCHQWKERLGNAGRRAYHDREWGEQMIRVGLYPSSTGAPGGKKTGQKVSHYIMDSGPFLETITEFVGGSTRISWYDAFPVRPSRKAGLVYDDIGQPIEGKISPPPIARKEIRDALHIASAGASIEGGATAPSKAPPRGPGVEGYRLPATPGTAPAAGSEGGEAGGEPTENWPARPASVTRTKFSCPDCHTNAWGKPALHIICGDCSTRMEPAT